MTNTPVLHTTSENTYLEKHKPPVFLCGYPKSGTTLLLALLDRHPQLLVFPEESKFFAKLMGRPDRQTLDYVLTRTGANVLRYDETRFSSGYRNYTDLDFDAYVNELSSLWDASDKTDRALLESIIFSYGVVTEQTGKSYWVEKTPHNEYYLAEALQRWPTLRAISIVRDPRDNFSSYRKQRIKQSQELPLESFVTTWCQSLTAWEQFVMHHPDQGLLLRYDDLVRYPQTTMHKVCDFLQIDWDESLLKPTRNGVFWSGNSMYGTEFRGISGSSLGKYRSECTPQEVHFLEMWLGRVMVRCGWHPTSGPCTLRTMLREMTARGYRWPLQHRAMIAQVLQLHAPVVARSGYREIA